MSEKRNMTYALRIIVILDHKFNEFYFDFLLYTKSYRYVKIIEIGYIFGVILKKMYI